jgi:uncharacterized membrane protein YraQ (UPF0718 family)
LLRVAHLIVLPILNVYRKYYGLRMTGFLLGTSFVAIVGAALVIEVLFGAIGSIPETRTARVVEPEVTLNYTTVLNVVFLALSALLVWRFARTGGVRMLRMMSGPPREEAHR